MEVRRRGSRLCWSFQTNPRAAFIKLLLPMPSKFSNLCDPGVECRSYSLHVRLQEATDAE
jgi:hypothetical protein